MTTSTIGGQKPVQPQPQLNSNENKYNEDNIDTSHDLQWENKVLRGSVLLFEKEKILQTKSHRSLSNELAGYKNKLDEEILESDYNRGIIADLQQTLSLSFEHKKCKSQLIKEIDKNRSHLEYKTTDKDTYMHHSLTPEPNHHSSITYQHEYSSTPIPIPSAPPLTLTKSIDIESKYQLLIKYDDTQIRRINRTKNHCHSRRRRSVPNINLMPSFINLFADKITNAIISKDDNNTYNHNISYSDNDDDVLSVNSQRVKELEFENLRLKQNVDKYHNLYKMIMNVNKELNVKRVEMEGIIGENNEILDKQALYILNVRDELMDMKNIIHDKDKNIQCLMQEIREKKNTYVSHISLPKTEKTHKRNLTPGGYQLNKLTWEQSRGFKSRQKNKTYGIVSVLDENSSEDTSDSDILEDDTPCSVLSPLFIHFEERIKQRPDWQYLQQQGILLDDITNNLNYDSQAEQRADRKRRYSRKIENLLLTRPTPHEIAYRNIISKQYANFIGTDDISAMDMDIDYIIEPLNSTFVDISPINLVSTLDWNKFDIKLRQRPSIDETMSRGILQVRPDSNINYDLHHRQQQMHRRRVSLNVEKLLKGRPTNVDDMHMKLKMRNILMTEHEVKEKQKHKRQQSIDLDEKLKKRRSITDIISLGGLFSSVGRGYFGGDFDEFNYNSVIENDGRGVDIRDTGIPVDVNTAGVVRLFQHEPRTSKPLQDFITDFNGMEFGDDYQFIDNVDDDGVFVPDSKRRSSIEYVPHHPQRTMSGIIRNQMMNGGQSTDDALIIDYIKQSHETPKVASNFGIMATFDTLPSFKPELLNRTDLIERMNRKISQRSSILEMQMRGILYDHPNVSRSLIQRSQMLQKRRACKKVNNLLNNRPKRIDLERRNILLRENDTLEKRRRHKRKTSRDLENSLQLRPIPLGESESKQAITSGIPVINIGGLIIPLVPPSMIGSLAGKHALHQQQKIEFLEDCIQDLSQDISTKDAMIYDLQSRNIVTHLKEANIALKSRIARLEMKVQFSSGDMHQAAQFLNLKNENDDLVELLQRNKSYFSHLTFHMKERGIHMPTAQQMKDHLRARLTHHLSSRPTPQEMVLKNILSMDYMQAPQTQNQSKVLHFRRTSAIVSELLENRPSRHQLLESGLMMGDFFFVEEDEYRDNTPVGKDGIGYTMEIDIAPPTIEEERMEFSDEDVLENIIQQRQLFLQKRQQRIDEEDEDIVASDIIEDDADIQQLKQESVRLRDMLTQTAHWNRELVRENSSLRVQMENTTKPILAPLDRRLKQHSTIDEPKAFAEIALELQNDVHKREVNELEIRLQAKSEEIRRLSCVIQQPVEFHVPTNDKLYELIQWSKRLSWPNLISQIFNNEITDDTKSDSSDDESLFLMQNVINEYRKLFNNEISNMRQEFKMEQRQLMLENETLNNQLQKESLKHKHQISLINGLPTMSAMFDCPEKALAALENKDPKTQQIIRLQKRIEKQKMEHLRDKGNIVNNLILEIDRLRNEIRMLGNEQMMRIKAKAERDAFDNHSYVECGYNYVSSYFWNSESTVKSGNINGNDN